MTRPLRLALYALAAVLMVPALMMLADAYAGAGAPITART